jgi:EF-hand domain-containing protein 1
MNDLPNLPGVRRDVSQLNPKLYKEFKLSQSHGSVQVEEDQSLASYFEDSSKFDFSRVTTPFPTDGNAFNDITGRYSLVSQRRDRVSKSRALPYSSTASLPSFVTNDTVPCCFVAYFIEPRTDVTEERARKVHIKVYADDDSIEILEPRIENSGTTQGKFLKRHQVFKPLQRLSDKKELLTIADMHSGAQVEIYNRLYTLVDCDASTRAELRRRGLPDFGPALAVPQSLYDPRTRSGAFRPSATRAANSSLMQTTSAATTGRGFFEYDRQVLRFFGLWDSRAQLFGDALQVKVHYYLADDKIEIVSVLDRNSGRDPLPTLLKKTRLLKRPRIDSPTSKTRPPTSPQREGDQPPQQAHQTVVDDRPYHWHDLRIGEVISVAALDVLLYDADEFTRSFYASHGLPLEPPLPMETPVYPTVVNEIPPHNGFGSEEDSLQTCKSSLIPSAPMKDGMKAKLYQGMVLRYAAKMHNPGVRTY